MFRKRSHEGQRVLQPSKVFICRDSLDDRMTAGRFLVWLRSVKGKGTSTTSHLSKFVIDRVVLIIPFRKA